MCRLCIDFVHIDFVCIDFVCVFKLLQQTAVVTQRYTQQQRTAIIPREQIYYNTLILIQINKPLDI